MSKSDKNIEEEISFLDFCISQTQEDIELSKKGEYRFTNPGVLKIADREYDRWLPEWIHSEAVRMLEKFENKISPGTKSFSEYLEKVLEFEQKAIEIMKTESTVRQRYVFNEPGFEEAVREECKKYSQYLQVEHPERFDKAKEDRQKLEYLLRNAEPGKESELRKFLEKTYEGYLNPRYEEVKNIIADKKTGLIFTTGRISRYSTMYRKKGEEYVKMEQPMILELQIAQLFKVEPEALATPEARKNIKLDKPIDRMEIGCIHYDEEDKSRCENSGYRDGGCSFENPDKLVQDYHPERSWRTYGGTNPDKLIIVEFDNGRLRQEYKKM